MKVLVVENFDHTTPGLVGEALGEAGVEITRVRAHHGEPLPEGPGGLDGLVVLGGGQSAVDDDEHPYLPGLAELTRTFGEAGRPVLGICLGAQLVARGHGGGNVLGRPVEFGYHAVTPLEAARSDPVLAALCAPSSMFHWHQDTVTLPPGAVHLASSAATPVQAFRIGRAVYGIQFHFEASRALVNVWSEVFAAPIAAHTPDWPTRKAGELATKGPAADDIGLDIARRWVALL